MVASTLRPPTAADAEAVLEIVLARDVADVGAPDFTLEDLRADWERPGLGTRLRRWAEGRATERGTAVLRPSWEAERWEKTL